MVTRLGLLVALASIAVAAGKPALDVGAGANVALPRCSPEGYGLEQESVRSAAHVQHAVRITVGWLTGMEKRRSCLLRTTIRLTIADSKSMVVSAHWSVNSVRRPWSGIVHTWAWKNWCEPTGQGEPTVEFSVPQGRTVAQRIASPPACVNAGAPSSITDLGTGTKYVHRPWQRIPPHILAKGSPPPIPYELINPENGWIVSDGYTLVAVYAGSPGEKPTLGRVAIVRQNEIFGIQYNPPDIVDVGKIGAIMISRAPRGRSHETSAQTGRLAFVSANGTRGVLDLRNDRVRITHRG
jgi:hypothetical protein